MPHVKRQHFIRFGPLALAFVLLAPPAVPAAEPAPPLKGLNELVGEWESESRLPNGKVETRKIRYRWINDGRSLEAESERVADGPPVRMRILYFWDPAAGVARALTVGSDGSSGQSDVTIADGKVRLDTVGVTGDGKRLKLVSTLAPGPGGTRTEQWTNRSLDGAPLPDAPVIYWRRASSLTESTWAEARAARQAQIDRHLKNSPAGYAWFTDSMHGEQAGTPYLFFLSLPELAPDLWGPPAERLARFGFLEDTKDPGRPLPLGLGWVIDPGRGDKPDPELHTVTLTCAACHVGQVRTPDPMLLVGAPNTVIDVRKFRRAMELTTDRLLNDAALPETAARLVELLKSKPPGHYFKGRYGIDAQTEAKERAAFENPERVARVLKEFAAKVRGGRAAVVKQLQTSYSKPNAPPLDGGTPGQSDGSGDLIPKLILFREVNGPPLGDPVKRFLTTTYLEMPASATATDNLSVWNQWDRPFGQLDASIRSPVIRNVAAETAVVGGPIKRSGDHYISAVNVKNADICASFLSRLPSPPYPFDVDVARARRGEVIFREHCAGCHRAGNGEVYGFEKIGTDMNRARVLSKEGKSLLLNSFKSAIPADYVATRPEGGVYMPATLSDDEIINDRVAPERQGYAAGPLDGVWARAPYLHNGSVPTLRHLLAPGDPGSRRPPKFVRGSALYDVKNVGFRWDPAALAALSADAPTAVLFDTGWDGASNRGHQADVIVDGKPRRLDWSGPEHAEALEDLIEYLKTL